MKHICKNCAWPQEPKTRTQIPREQAQNRSMLHAVNILDDMLITNYSANLITHLFGCHHVKAIWKKDFSVKY